MRKDKHNYQSSPDPDPYEDVVRLNDLDPYESQIKSNYVRKKNNKSF